MVVNLQNYPPAKLLRKTEDTKAFQIVYWNNKYCSACLGGYLRCHTDCWVSLLRYPGIYSIWEKIKVVAVLQLVVHTVWHPGAVFQGKIKKKRADISLLSWIWRRHSAPVQEVMLRRSEEGRLTPSETAAFCAYVRTPWSSWVNSSCQNDRSARVFGSVFSFFLRAKTISFRCF